MQYYFSKFLAMPFDDAVAHVTKALAAKALAEAQAGHRFQAVHDPWRLQSALREESPTGRRQDWHDASVQT
jgi:hypothetical protein